MPNYSSDLNAIFQALADPTRRAVLERLCKGPAQVTELAEPFDMALPSFAQHLNMLERCGLIRTEKVGRVRNVELAPKKLKEAERWMTDQRALWDRRLNQLDAFLLQQKEKR